MRSAHALAFACQLRSCLLLTNTLARVPSPSHPSALAMETTSPTRRAPLRRADPHLTFTLAFAAILTPTLTFTPTLTSTFTSTPTPQA